LRSERKVFAVAVETGVGNARGTGVEKAAGTTARTKRALYFIVAMH